jgi:hypothetical protein
LKNVVSMSPECMCVAAMARTMRTVLRLKTGENVSK